MADVVDHLKANPQATDAADLCGHTNLRVGALDDLMRPATEDQISPMKDNLSKARLQAQWGYQRVLPMIRQTLFQLVIF